MPIFFATFIVSPPQLQFQEQVVMVASIFFHFNGIHERDLQQDTKIFLSCDGKSKGAWIPVYRPKKKKMKRKRKRGVCVRSWLIMELMLVRIPI